MTEENIVFQSKPSWLHYIPQLIITALLLFPAYYFFVVYRFWGYLPSVQKRLPTSIAPWLSLIVVLLPVMFFLIILTMLFINRMSHTFIVTNEGVKHKKGLFLITKERSAPLIPFSKIQWVKPLQNRMEQILGIGHILFDTASDKKGPDMIFFGIKDHNHVAEKIEKMIPKGG